MKRQTRAKLARFYYDVTVLPGLDPRVVDMSANMTMTLIESKKRIDIRDLQLPWRPLYDALVHEMFPKKRKTGIS
jgi:proteasome activator subunit 4